MAEKCWNFNLEGLGFLVLKKLLALIEILMRNSKSVSTILFVFHMIFFKKIIMLCKGCSCFLGCLVIILFMCLLLHEKLRSKFVVVFVSSVWANHGDDISIQYSGTPALKGDFVRYFFMDL